MKNISERVIHVFCEQMGVPNGVDDVNKDARTTYGMDSLDEVEMVMAIEDEFTIEIADEDAERWKTIGDIINYVTKVQS